MAVESIIVNIVSNIGKIAKDTDKATKSLGGFKGAIKGIGTALKAAGIGIVLAIMGKFFQLLSKNQTVVDFFNTSMNGLNIILSDLINSFGTFFNFIGDNIGTVIGYFKELFEDPVQKLKDLGAAIEEHVNESFDSLIETLGHVAKAFGHLFKGEWAEAWESVKDAGKEVVDVFTGVDDSFDKIKETVTKVTTAIGGYVTGTWKAAKATTELDKEVARLGVTLDRTNKKFAANALEQQQIIDNELLSFEKRHEALDELTRLTEENNQANIDAAALRVKQAQDLVDLNGNEANKIALMKEENTLMDAKAQKLAAEEELFDSFIMLNDQWNEAQSKAYDEEMKRLKELADFKKQLQDDAIAALGANLNASMDELEGNYSKEKRLAEEQGKDTTAIDEKYEKKREKIAKQQKAFKVAEALITAYQMASLAYKDGLEAGGPAGLALGPIAAAVAIAAGLANVRSILAQDVGGGAGGGTGGGVAETPAPEMMSGAFTLGGGQAVEPARAYVVSDDITNNQNKLAIIRRRATI